MRTELEAVEQFVYHPATPAAAATYAQLRGLVVGLTQDAWALIPDGPEKTLAFRALQQFLMYANLAVALTTPPDLTTAHIARVLPEDSNA